ncbi:MAG: GFA family protein [Rubrobacteraceae bacterium]
MCGNVRYAVAGGPGSAVYCHCSDCRRWSGGPVVVLARCSTAQLRVLGEEPRSYASSPGVKRSFCGRCGTPFSYEDERLPGEIYLSIGVFDEPDIIEPGGHSWFSSKLDWLHIKDDLPRYGKSSRPR